MSTFHVIEARRTVENAVSQGLWELKTALQRYRYIQKDGRIMLVQSLSFENTQRNKVTKPF